MAWTSPKTWAVGNVLTASEMNTYVRDNAAFLNAPPSARVYNNADISIPNATGTTLTFNSERWDTDTIHSTSTNTARLTCQTAGIYHIFAHVVFANNTTGSRGIAIRHSVAELIAAQYISASVDSQTISISTIYTMTVGQYVTTEAYQSSGGALNVTYTVNYSPDFGMTYLGAT